MYFHRYPKWLNLRYHRALSTTWWAIYVWALGRLPCWRVRRVPETLLAELRHGDHSPFLYFCISVFFMYFPTFPLKTLYGNDSLTYNFFHLNPAVENITSVSNLRPSIFRFCCWLPLVLLALHDGTVVMIIIVVAMITDIKMMIIIIVMMITDCLSRWYEEKQL